MGSEKWRNFKLSKSVIWQTGVVCAQEGGTKVTQKWQVASPCLKVDMLTYASSFYLRGKKGWGILNSLRYPKTYFFLSFKKHYYCVTGVRKVTRVGNFSELCYLLNRHCHSCSWLFVSILCSLSGDKDKVAELQSE